MTDPIREVAPPPTLRERALAAADHSGNDAATALAILHLADTVDRAADRVANAIAGLVGGQQ